MMLWINHYWRITDLCYHVNYATSVLNLGFCRNCHDRDRMVVGFTSIHATHKVVSLTIGRVDVIKFISRCIAVSGYSIMSNHYILTFWTELKICMLDIKQTINQSINQNKSPSRYNWIIVESCVKYWFFYPSIYWPENGININK
jgi:hypothetical protein